jgi:ABC-2 type transport system permease protein
MITSFLRNMSLARHAFIEQARAETAYIRNFWFTLISRILYNITFLIFIDALFQRVGHVAGYSRSDFMFMFFVSQLGFYVMYLIVFTGLLKLVENVRTGQFDLLLLKPVPHRLFLYIRGMVPIDFLFTCATTLPLILMQINWGEISLSPGSLALGAVVWVCGMIIGNTFLFALTLPAFRAGDASDMMNIFYAVTGMSQVPYSKLPVFMKVLSLTILSQLIIAAAATEIVLMKGDALGVSLAAIIAAVISVIIFNQLWRYALRNYTSASS